jgi:16S rRNA (cytidine1402-2'-O)-methyltransferase
MEMGAKETGGAESSGTLYLVATPIGNLDDVTARALRVLREATVVAAEDTRRTGRLLAHYEISASLVSFHDHNKERKWPELIASLERCEDVALVTDAGTPGISDPGYLLVAKAVERGLTVSPIPGPCAFLQALIVSGLPTDRFAFEGFLPRKAGVRARRLSELADDPRTLIFHESPHRLVKSLAALREGLGDRRAAVARELTKRFEEIRRGPLSALEAHYTDHPPRGECVIVVAGRARGGSD